MPPIPFKKKPLTPEQIHSFWSDYDAGKRLGESQKVFEHRKQERLKRGKTGKKEWTPSWFDPTGRRLREPVAFRIGQLGTVRHFPNKKNMLTFLQCVQKINRLGERLENVDFIPTKILAIDQSRLRLVESAAMAPTLYDVRYFYDVLPTVSRYGKRFLKKMSEKERKVSVKQMQEAMEEVSDAVSELHHQLMSQGIPFDPSPSNILILDYNPKTRRPSIMIVDHGGSIQTFPQ